MRIWFALILAPSLALGCQSVMYSLVTPECSNQTRVAIHAVAAVSLLLCLVFTAMARLSSAPDAASADDDMSTPPAARNFLAIVAAAVGAISSLTIIGMWIGAWVLSPCF
jgi:heme A synthase